MSQQKTQYEVRDETGYLLSTVDGLANAKRKAGRLYADGYGDELTIHNQTHRGTKLVGRIRFYLFQFSKNYTVSWNDVPKMMSYNQFEKWMRS